MLAHDFPLLNVYIRLITNLISNVIINSQNIKTTTAYQQKQVKNNNKFEIQTS